jgi:Kef-type K+ transport system membrane component KefB
MKTEKHLWWLAGLSLALLLAVVFSHGELTKCMSGLEVGTAAAAVNAAAAESEAAAEGHGDPYALVFEIFAFLLVAAVVGRFLASKLKQSPVLGELLIGILLGAVLYQVGNPVVTTLRHFEEIEQAGQKVLHKNIGWQEALKETLQETPLTVSKQTRIEKVALSPNFPQYRFLAQVLQLFSGLGVIMLLFLVGLECSLEEMLSVGGSAAGVAVLGVIFPLVLGFLVTWGLMPGLPNLNVPIFMGATMCATSIGITARVFKDLHRMGTPEAKVVLGAAVLDDILGLIVLAAVTGIIASGALKITAVSYIIGKALVFLGAVVLFGRYLLNRQIAFFAILDRTNVKLLYPFCLLLILAWLADLMGLATIVGAFAAGLIIKDETFTVYQKGHYGDRSVESIMAPLEGVFAPIFFVLMGLQVDISTFINPRVLLMGLIITAVAVVTKVAAALPLSKGFNRLVVGLGMVPRGEVGLIFASIGRVMGILDTSMYSVVIIMVLLTTLVTPPALSWVLVDRKVSRRENA